MSSAIRFDNHSNNSRNAPVIILKHLTKAYRKGQFVLQNFSLEVAPGEFLAVLGPSGCGKTTLLRLIAGLETPDHGEIFIAGKNMTAVPAEKRPVNTVFQNYALFPHMTVADNIAFGLRVRKIPKTEIAGYIQEILNRVHLTGYENRMPQELSGGQKQRVALARALVNKPKVLLLDEPMAALDENLRRKMQLELKALQRELGITFIMVTHDQDEALSMADRVALMNAGQLEQIGTPLDLYHHPRSEFAARFVGENNFFHFRKSVNRADLYEFELGHLAFPGHLPDSFTGAVRPEFFQLLADANGALFQATVSSIIFKGATVIVNAVSENNFSLLAEFPVSQAAQLKEGKIIYLTFSAGDVCVLES